MSRSIESHVDGLLPQASELLCALIAIRSLSGVEEEAVAHAARAFERLGLGVQLQPIPETIRDDPDYCGRELNLRYEGRHNLIVKRPGSARGRSVILQTHLDVVPAGHWADAFEPCVDNGVVRGRGACDCKGQAAVLWLTLAALEAANVQLLGDIAVQLVVEEEIGGNGALATLAAGGRADAAVILEPTGLQIHPACRGACWFRITVEGRTVHMGRRHTGVSAFEKAVRLYEDLAGYERALIADSAGQPLFERYDHPVQVNVGTVQAGEWPSMVPAECVMEGGVGFLPNRPMRQIQEDLRRLISSSDDPWIREHAKIEFPKLRNDAYASDPNDPAVISLADACRREGLSSEVFGWNVSCDARLYALRGGMPAIVFGPGDVADAHSDHEQIRLTDIASAAGALAGFLMDYCGVV